MTLLKKALADELTSRRKTLNLSPLQMAQKYHITLEQYYNIEYGKWFPSVKNFLNIAVALRIDLNEFVEKLQQKKII